jgi:hypothetical protein
MFYKVKPLQPAELLSTASYRAGEMIESRRINKNLLGLLKCWQ